MLRPQLFLRGALRPCLEGAAGITLQTASLVGCTEPSQLLFKQPLRQAPRHLHNLTFDTRSQHTAALLEQDDDDHHEDEEYHDDAYLGHHAVAQPRKQPAAPAFRRTAMEGPLAKYEEGKEAGLYRSDPRQEVCINMLQDLYHLLKKEYPAPQRPSGLTLVDNIAVTQCKDSWWTGVSHLLRSTSGLRPQPGLVPAHHVIGLYMYGGVGTGKTMLMDLFVHSAPREFQVTRAHFHEFMQDVHAKLRRFKDDPNPLLKAADCIASSTKVLCLDELFVTDVADAMILNRLFTRLWAQGLTLVATSNRAPKALYEGGLQRQLFLPFIAHLEEECVVHDMASPTDYRRLAHHQQGLYLLTPDREALLQERLHQMAEGRPVRPEDVQVAMGRTLHTPAAAGPVCHFTFEELCGRPLGAADYIALTEHYHTLLLSGVPAFGAANRPEAYRFVTLIDVLYEHKIRLVVSADAPPFELFEKIITQAEARARPPGAEDVGDLVVDDNLGFARERTTSRLSEMGSLEYLSAHAQLHAPELVLALKEATDKRIAEEGK